MAFGKKESCGLFGIYGDRQAVSRTPTLDCLVFSIAGRSRRVSQPVTVKPSIATPEWVQ